MRDVILRRVGAGVRTRKAKGDHYDTLLQETPAGVPVDVTRGWTQVDAKVGGSGWFRFVNTHFEAFDSQSSNHTNQNTDVPRGGVRKAQAKQLVGPGGAARSRLPVVLLGDLNSDDDTVSDGDRKGYRVLRQAGFRERSTDNPLGCCLNSGDLRVGHGGHRSDFDHQVDHVLTDAPKRIGLANSSVTGLKPVNGFWDSDHAGLFSSLLFR